MGCAVAKPHAKGNSMATILLQETSDKSPPDDRLLSHGANMAKTSWVIVSFGEHEKVFCPPRFGIGSN
jgi:hypothetical protein